MRLSLSIGLSLSLCVQALGQNPLDFEQGLLKFPLLTEGAKLREADFMEAWQGQALDPKQQQGILGFHPESAEVYPLAQYQASGRFVVLFLLCTDRQPDWQAEESGSYRAWVQAHLYDRQKTRLVDSSGLQPRLYLQREPYRDSLGQPTWARTGGYIFLEQERYIHFVQSYQADERILHIQHYETIYKATRRGFDFRPQSARPALDAQLLEGLAA